MRLGKILQTPLSAILTLSVCLSAMATGGLCAQKTTEDEGEFIIYSNVFYAPGSDNRNWCEGMVSGNGESGVITSGVPYSDTLIYQNISFNMPNNNYREVMPGMSEELEESRAAVINRDTSWNYNGRSRQRYYTFHPAHELRITTEEQAYSNYKRWTNYESAEVGVSYSDAYGSWERTTFTSRADDVTITRIGKSSANRKVDITLSIDNLSDLRGFGSGYEKNLAYKKIVSPNNDYIALVAHYPVTERGVLYHNAGYAGVTQVIAIGGTKEKVSLSGTKESQNVGSEANPAIKISGAEAVYLITRADNSFTMGKMSSFPSTQTYDLVNDLFAQTDAVVKKYTFGGLFDYDKALAAHVALHKPEFDNVKIDLNSTAADRALSNEELIAKQKSSSELNAAFVERAYYAGRYAQLCCAGYSTSRLGGMWTGEWNSPWGGLWTMDANVNLQVSALNTGNISFSPIGYISFILRQVGDWQTNAEKIYGMHDAILSPHNTDGESAFMIQSDASYPLQYWNASASWMLLPIYEYWQCYGNSHIPIPKEVDLHKIKGILGVNDGGLSEAQVDALIQRGYLDLEVDILLPLLIKQSNFWEQLCTPEYYTDANGNHKYTKDKTKLEAGERYLIIPSYSPENAPSGSYNRPTALNATMDIAAARDGLDMAIALEKAVNGEANNDNIARWKALKEKLPEYQLDGEVGSATTSTGGGGALREWATQTYTERNGHRHLSHLYVAWPGYETKTDEWLYTAAVLALQNRLRLNSGDATTGHGWIHQSLVAARLGNKDIVDANMKTLMKSNIYFTSMMTDHNTNRGSNAYCTDTLIGMTGVINESLVYSNTGEIEVLPTLLDTWKTGSISGIRARTRALINKLEWDMDQGAVKVEITSDENQEIKLSSGETWYSASVQGCDAVVNAQEEITLKMQAGETAFITLYGFVSDKATLQSKITQAQAELESKSADSYALKKAAVNAAFEQVITKAQALYNRSDASADDITAMVLEINEATEAFKAAYDYTISFSLGSGAYFEEKSVKIASQLDERVEIRYTTDNSTPTATSLLYDGEIRIGSGITYIVAQQFIKETKAAIGSSISAKYICANGENFAYKKTATTTNAIYSGQGPDKAINGNTADRFSIKGGTNPQILQIDLGALYTFDMLYIDEFVETSEQYRVKSYKLYYDDNGVWKEAHSFDGSETANDALLRDKTQNPSKHAYLGAVFGDVTTSKVKLEVQGTKEISLWEVGLYKTVASLKASDAAYLLNGKIDNICDTQTLEQLNLAETDGVRVLSAGTNTLAYRRGLYYNDVITKVNDISIADVAHLREVYGSVADGTTVALCVNRGGVEQTLLYKKTADDMKLIQPEVVEAEDCTLLSGYAAVQRTTDGAVISGARSGDYLVYENVLFTKSPERWLIHASAAEDCQGSIKIRIDDWDGLILGEVIVNATADGYKTFAVKASQTAEGVHNMYIELAEGVNVDWIAGADMGDAELEALIELCGHKNALAFTALSYKAFYDVYVSAKELSARPSYSAADAREMISALNSAIAALEERGSETLYAQNTYNYAANALETDLENLSDSDKQRVKDAMTELVDALTAHDTNAQVDIDAYADALIDALNAVSGLTADYFAEGFEDGFSLWTAGGKPLPTPASSTQIKRSGESAYVVNQDFEYIEKTFTDLMEKTASVWFYDDMSTSKRSFVFCDAGTKRVGMGINTSTSETHYAYRASLSSVLSFQTSSVARSVGWHEAKFVYEGGKCVMYIDGEHIYTLDGTEGFCYLAMGDFWGDNLGAPPLYFDDVAIYDTSEYIGDMKVIFTSDSGGETDITGKGPVYLKGAQKGKLQSSLTVISLGDMKDVMLITALYRSDTLADIVLNKVELRWGEEEIIKTQLDIDIPPEHDDYTLAVFLWSANGSLKPYYLKTM
ncbi:MAG: glycoside hydrolase N-terminal domain-containing protein [Clostridia bacterium]|nr:glycoside hydrolase N-terminal domain-containing protein [Clostridia bacterium]